MNAIAHANRPSRWLIRNSIAAGLGIALLVLAGTAPSPAFAATAEAARTIAPIERQAVSLRAQYRQQQWARLSQMHDRDSLIAAVLLGMPNEFDHAPIDGHDAVEQRLAQAFGHDATAMFVVALACQVQHEPCAHPEYYDALVQIAPDNATHWLVLPNGAAPNDAQLHSAASATMADSHLGTMIGILRAALADQPAPTAMGSRADSRQLSLALRRNAVDQVPVLKYAAVIAMCKPASTSSRADCIGLGRRLYNDRSGTLVTRMIGSVILRRLEKGSWEDTRAKQLRREYVWMGEQLDMDDSATREQMQRDTVRFGEWSAMQRAVLRTGTSTTPPSGWVPKNPQTLLMTEERTPAQ